MGIQKSREWGGFKKIDFEIWGGAPILEHSSFDSLYLYSFLFSAFAVYIIGFSSFNFVFSISCMILCVLTFFSKIVLSTSPFPFFCICCSYHLKFIISLFCSLNYSLHFLFFFLSMLYPVLEVFLYSDLFPMLSAVSCLYFFHSCYFCILYLSLLTFLIFVFASFYFLLFFILSSYLFLFFTLQFALLYFCASFRCLFIIAFSLIYGLSFSHFLCILKSSF